MGWRRFYRLKPRLVTPGMELTAALDG